MAWEERERGGSYYTRSRRENGLVVREYVGTGPLAALAAHTDEVIRQGREARRKEAAAKLESMRSLAAPVLELDDLAATLTRAHLVAGGYHRHKGEWRRATGRARREVRTHPTDA